MGKIQLGPKALIYPLPIVLVGANVDRKPNFMAAAWCGVVNGTPPMVSVALHLRRYTLQGVRQNHTFSINIPNIGLMKEADYCGITSGSKVNKAEDCRFNVFYGKLGTAPLIEQCPINIECQVLHSLELPDHVLFVGIVEETHVSENCLTDGEPDVDKIKPLIYTPAPARQYQVFGEVVGKAFRVGKELTPQITAK